MKVLLDTCVISELWRKGGSERVRNCVSILKPHDTYLSVLTVGELTKGIQLLKESKRKRDLQNKLTFLESEYKANIFDIDLKIIKLWGEIVADSQKKGKIIPVSDGLIAATAKCYDLQIMTLNISDFENVDVALTNPWN